MAGEATSTAFTVNGSANSDINSTFDPPDNILYRDFQATDITAGNSVEVAQFTIRDGAGTDPDPLGTTLTAIQFNVTGSSLLRRIALYDGTTELGEVATGSTASFSALTLTAPDDGSKTFSIRVTFQSTVSDNSNFRFTVNSANAAASGSLFATADAGGAQSSMAGDDNRIEVLADRLIITTQAPATAFVLTNLSITPVVQARDVNGNTDLDYVTSITVSNAAGIPMDALGGGNTVAPVAGVATFPAAFQYRDRGNGTLTLTSGSLINAVSTPVAVSYDNNNRINPGALVEPATISSLSTSAPGTDVFDFVIVDDNGSGGDGSPTRFTTLTITQGTGNDIGNWTEALAGATLTVGASTLTGAIASNTITFSGLANSFATDPGFIADNGDKTYTLRVWLRTALGGTLRTTIDNQNLVFDFAESGVALVTVGTPASSDFTAAGTQLQTSGNNNQVSVVANALVFTNPSAPQIIGLNVTFASPLRVEARDANSNVDLDYTGIISSSTTTATAADGPVGGVFAAGVYNFPANYRYTTDAGGVVGGGTITLTSAGPIIGTSPTITIQASASSAIVEETTTFSYSLRIPYVTDANQTLSGTSTSLAGYRLIDGNLADADLAGTIINSITFSVATQINETGPFNPGSTAIKTIGLFTSGGTLISSQSYSGAASVTFNSLTITAADDNFTTFVVKAAYNNTYPAVGDRDVIRLQITDVDLAPTSSKLAPTGSVVGGDYTLADGSVTGSTPTPATTANKINVVADRLAFTTQPAALVGRLEPYGSIANPTVPEIQARDQFTIVDFEFNNSGSISASASLSPTSINFNEGVLSLAGLQYLSAGNGTLTVSTTGPVLNSSVAPSVGCNNVEVLDVYSTAIAAGTGGVESAANLGGGSVNKVIFGVSFNVPYQAGGNPKLNGFTISFGNPEGPGGVEANPTTSVTSILKNIKIFETAGPNFALSPIDITTITGSIAPSGGDKLVVSFGTPRNLSTGLPTSYFLVVDIDPSANGSTPKLQPYIIDEGYTEPMNNGNIVTNQGSSYSQNNLGVPGTISAGPTYSFAALFPPILARTYPTNGQLNVSKNQPNVMLAFNVPVWSLDQKVQLRNLQTGAPVATLSLATTPLGAYPASTTSTANLTDSLYFDIPPGTLKEDTLYYITVEKGALGRPELTLDPTNTGIMDQAGNRYPGFDYSGTFFFKVIDPTPPELLPASANGEVTRISDVSQAGATIVGTFDKPGRAFYIVVDPTTAPPAPTVAQLKNPATYVNPAKVASGNFVISQVDPIPQSGAINASQAPGGRFTVGVNYRVYLYSESYEEIGDAALPFPPSAPTSTAIVNTNYHGAAPSFAVGSLGDPATFTFQPTAIPANVTYNNNPGPAVAINICSNSFQQLNLPIWIREGSAQNDFRSLGAPTDVLTLNLILPTGFEFDVSLDANKPRYGRVVLSGTDFSGVGNTPITGEPGNFLGELQFINNTILEVSFRNSGSASLDQISITGLRVKGTGSVSGNIRRLGGNAIPAIGNNVAVATLIAQPLSPSNANFTNSYAIETFGPASTVTNIPDNFNGPAFQVTLVPKPVIGDFGITTFSGPGVNVNQLALKAVTLDIPFNISAQRTNPNGCVANTSVQYTVYDSRRAIGGLLTNYCYTDTNFGLGAASSSVNTIAYNNLPAFYLRQIETSIPRSAPASQKINETEWITFLTTPNLFAVRGPAVPNPGDNPVPGRQYFNYSFDSKTMLDARFSISVDGAPAAPNHPYEYFRKRTTDFGQNQVYYEGGSLGLVEFKAIYQSIANSADDSFTLFQNVEFFLPPVPIVEVDLTNETVTGTRKYCEQGGLIRISGYPKPAAGVSQGIFTLWDGATQITSLPTNSFVDNGNGTATIDPALFSNSYRPIRIQYDFNQFASPCSGTANLTIQVTPNPEPQFTTSILCEDVAVNFTNQSFFANTPPPGLIIDRYRWDFSDPNSGTANTSILQNPQHTYAQAGLYSNVSLMVQSSDNCFAVAPATQNLRVGATPAVDFSFLGIDTSAPIAFRDDSQISTAATDVDDGFQQLTWTLGNGSPPNVITYSPHKNVVELDPADDDFNFTYPQPGVFQVNLNVRSNKGCQANLSKDIVILPRYVTSATNSYVNEGTFEANSGGWQVYGTPARPSATLPTWAHGTPGGAVINTASSGTNAWVTNRTGNYSSNEFSALYSPNFDTRLLERPMVSFNTFVRLAQNDGVVLQYSTDDKNVADPTKQWRVLGEVNQGIGWYNQSNIGSKPGEQAVGDIGWTGINNTWQDSKFALVVQGTSNIIQQQNVVFRFALASNGNGEEEGFALDNFRLGERTRTILLESFTNVANDTKIGNTFVEQMVNDSIRNFNATNVGLEVVKFNYHVGFPGIDPFNQDNPADPSARALYYNIDKTPASRLDGEGNPDPNPNQQLFSQWGRREFNKRSLQLAQANLVIRPANPGPNGFTTGGKVAFFIDVIPASNLPANTILYTGILEESVPKASLLERQNLVKSNESVFEYVVKKMLPSVVGLKTGALVAGPPSAPITYPFGPFEWIPDMPFYGPTTDDLAIGVFLQNEDTKEIYQSEIVFDLDDPVVTVTSLEDLLPEDVLAYPNPANEQLTVELPARFDQPIRLRMVDQLGRALEAGNIPTGETKQTIDTSNLAAGMYLLQLEGIQGTPVRKKVIIVH
ncbi:MAG: T9SS type A sorting domain-containing protein [Cyclobacteriaceae bacterium]